MSHNIVNVVRHTLLSEVRYGRPPTVTRICAITGMARTAVERCLVIIEAQNWTQPLAAPNVIALPLAADEGAEAALLGEPLAHVRIRAERIAAKGYHLAVANDQESAA